MKTLLYKFLVLFVIIISSSSLIGAEKAKANNDKLIIILPFKYTGTDYMTTEGDMRLLAANSVQVELAREGYNVMTDPEVNQEFTQLGSELSELTQAEIDTINQKVHADIFITGELIKLPTPYQDRYKLRVIYTAKDTEKNEIINRERMTYPIGFNTQWHNLLSEMSKQFIRSLKSRKAI